MSMVVWSVWSMFASCCFDDFVGFLLLLASVSVCFVMFRVCIFDLSAVFGLHVSPCLPPRLYKLQRKSRESKDVRSLLFLLIQGWFLHRNLQIFLSSGCWTYSKLFPSHFAYPLCEAGKTPKPQDTSNLSQTQAAHVFHISNMESLRRLAPCDCGGGYA